MQEKIRIVLKAAVGLAVVWVICMFAFCFFSERDLHRAKLQLQDSATQLAEEKEAHEEDRATTTELREMKLGLESKLRVLKKQLAAKRELSEGANAFQEVAIHGDDLQGGKGSALSGLERAGVKHELFRENRMLLSKIAESRHTLRTCRTSPCLEALNDEHLEKLQRIHAKWRADVQSLLNAASRAEADKVKRLQEQVRELADAADVLTGNTLLYSDQAERVVKASDALLDAVNTRQLLLKQSGESDTSNNSTPQKNITSYEQVH